MRSKLATEHQEQKCVIQWWDSYALTKGLDRRLLFAIPNGANKSIASAVKFKREGLRAGVPDLFLALPMLYKSSATFHGMFIEMKAQKGTVSKEQREYHNLLRHMDYNVITAFGADEAIRAIQVYVERART